MSDWPSTLGQMPFPIWYPKINHHTCPIEGRELVENSAWMPKDALGRDPGFKIPYLSPLPQEVAIPFYRCVNRGLLETRESPNIPDILRTLANRGCWPVHSAVPWFSTHSDGSPYSYLLPEEVCQITWKKEEIKTVNILGQKVPSASFNLGLEPTNHWGNYLILRNGIDWA